MIVWVLANTEYDIFPTFELHESRQAALARVPLTDWEDWAIWPHEVGQTTPGEPTDWTSTHDTRGHYERHICNIEGVKTPAALPPEFYEKRG